MKWDEILATKPSILLSNKKYEYLCDHFSHGWLKQPLTCNQGKKPCSDWYINNNNKKIKDRLC